MIFKTLLINLLRIFILHEFIIYKFKPIYAYPFTYMHRNTLTRYKQDNRQYFCIVFNIIEINI